jgi:hypothetical protein
VLCADTAPSGGVEEAVQYTRVVRQIARYGDSTSTFGVHCPIVLNSCAVVAFVDTGANVTCVLSSLLPALGAQLVVKEGKLEDYKGRLDDRIGVVRLRVVNYNPMMLSGIVKLWMVWRAVSGLL